MLDVCVENNHNVWSGALLTLLSFASVSWTQHCVHSKCISQHSTLVKCLSGRRRTQHSSSNGLRFNLQNLNSHDFIPFSLPISIRILCQINFPEMGKAYIDEWNVSKANETFPASFRLTLLFQAKCNRTAEWRIRFSRH